MASRPAFASRVRFVALLIIALGVVLLVRLYFVQVVHGGEYRLKAESQYVKQSTNQVDRGTIFFKARNGSLISAASLASGYTIALNPKLIADPQHTLDALKKDLPALDASSFIQKAENKDVIYNEVMRRVPEETGKTVSAEKIPGVQVLQERWRFYPGNSLAAQTIGFLGYGGGTTLTGQYGLERSYNDVLSRSQGGLYVNFFADLFTNIRSQFFSGDVIPGADLVTSIEPSTQLYLEGILKRYNDSWHPRVEGGIIMDPSTGEVVAMSSYPTFDLNNFKDVDPSLFGNPLVQSDYEFGSTMKAISMAAGIDSGAVTPQTTYNDKGSATFNGLTISNYDHKGRGVVSMQEVLNQSLNTGVAFVVGKMGTGAFESYFQKFGLTEETGIDLPSEASPLVGFQTTHRTIEDITASFGQGIAVTPIAMTRALATLANHGVVPGPHVGLELRYGGGLKKTLGWSPPRTAISPESAETITKMLVTVVDKALKHGTAKIPEYSIAAKTGTAQIALPNSRGYYTDRYLHSFFGYFPAYNPKFIIFLYAAEPKGAQYASETWTDPFIETVHFLINYYNIPPDRAPSGA